MTRLEQLICTLCPQGVEYKSLKELGCFFGGLSGKSKDDFTNGNAKFITYKNVYSNPALQIDIADKVKISADEKQHTLQYGDVIFTGSSETPDECGFSSVVTIPTEEKLYLNSFCFFFRFSDSNIILPDFAKHLFRSSNLRRQIIRTASGVTRFNVSKKLMGDVIIPLPPLEVQQEIVRILDQFTELTAELTTELTARKKQYMYYRDELLLGKHVHDFREYSLGELADIHTGSKPDEIFVEHSDFEYINAGTTHSGYAKTANCPGDTVTTPSRGQGGIGFVGYQSHPFHLGPLCYSIRSKDKNIIINKFIYYWLISHTSDILAFKKEGGTPAVNRADLIGLKIQVPQVSVQKFIIEILDRFDTLCNDLTSGLPAEIEARQRQYEHYRDKLLTFKEL